VLDIKQLEQLFEVRRFECAGVDGLICKIHLKAKTQGNFVSLTFLGFVNSKLLGLPVLIKQGKSK